MYYAYFIECLKTGRLYKGLCQDMAVRLKEHNQGKTKSTKGFGPWTLVYFEILSSLRLARSREKYLKSGTGREYLKSVLSSHAERPIKGPIVQGIPACRQAGNSKTCITHMS